MGKITWWDERFYRVLVPPTYKDIEYYPSSTTVLGIINKPFLNHWRGDVGNEVANFRSKVAKIKGSNIHEMIHSLLIGETVDGTDKEQEEWYQVVKFVDWFELFKPEVRLAEHEVVSHKHRYAGTLDILLNLKGGEYKLGSRDSLEIEEGLYVADIKTGKGLDKSYYYQTASYAEAVKEMGIAKEIKGTIIIHTGADTKLGWKVVVRNQDEMKDDFDAFRASLFLYQKNGEDKPKIIEMPKTLTLQKG